MGTPPTLFRTHSPRFPLHVLFELNQLYVVLPRFGSFPASLFSVVPKECFQPAFTVVLCNSGKQGLTLLDFHEGHVGGCHVHLLFVCVATFGRPNLCNVSYAPSQKRKRKKERKNMMLEETPVFPKASKLN